MAEMREDLERMNTQLAERTDYESDEYSERPAMIFSMVDFPAPFLPTRAMRSRRLIT